MTLKRFSGKFALVTGAAGGIGRECALSFAREGATVALIDRDQKPIDETLGMIEKAGGKGLAICIDVTDELAVSRAFDRTLKTFGAIDFAINNAGISQTGALTADIGLTEWNLILQVNVTGTWLCMREEIKHMGARGAGVIVNTASFAGLHTLATQTAYVASKHAVIGLTKNAAIEYAAQGIRINAVAPGGVATPMMEKNLAEVDPDHRASALEAIANFHPMKRVGKPGEIADAVLFLCSDQASFITGACLSVDGGWAAI
jgi:NAD(P)-dependent dehydrogenase (short-subunit alcohol dehydrogenase family)